MKFYRALHLIKILLISAGFISLALAQDNPEIKLAESYVRSGNHEAALFIFQKLYRQGNTSTRVINGISNSLEALNRIDEWIEFLHEVISRNPGIFPYQIDLANAYFLNKQNDMAREIWRSVYEAEPYNLMRYRLVAQAMTRFRLFDDAIAVYKQAMQNLKNQEAMHLDIGTLYRAQLNYEMAVEHYIEYYRRFKKQRNYIRSLLIGMAKDDEAADRIIAKLEMLNRDNDPDINELLANLYIRKKEYNRAFGIIKNIEESSAESQYLYLSRFAVEAERDNAFEYVIKAYEYAIAKNREALNASNRFKLAEAYYNFGDDLFKSGKQETAQQKVEKAISILQDLLTGKSPEKYFAAELIADINKDYYNDLDKALQYYNEVNFKAIGVNRADEVRLKKADVYILKNNLEQAAKIYEKVQSKKYLPEALFCQAELSYFNAQFREAGKKYQQVIAMVGMKDTLANNALERTFNIDQFSADSTEFAKYAKADLLKRQKKYSESAKEFARIYYNSNNLSLSSGMKAVNLYNRLNKTNEVITLLEDRLQKYPQDENNDQALFILAANYQKQDNPEQALTMYQDLLMRYPTSFYTDKARAYARELNQKIQQKVNP